MDNPLAFPSVCLNDPCHEASIPGMTLRDYFAGHALGYLGQRKDITIRNADDIASMVYELADALLAARTASVEE